MEGWDCVCPAHQKVVDVIGHDPVECSSCKGKGYEEREFFGEEVKGAIAMVKCLTCKGTKFMDIPRWDISMLKERRY